MLLRRKFWGIPLLRDADNTKRTTTMAECFQQKKEFAG